MQLRKLMSFNWEIIPIYNLLKFNINTIRVFSPDTNDAYHVYFRIIFSNFK